ncbi:UDP-glucose dehydrogenase family protein [Corynebacterium mendelii]|uniref:UDP-glucose 6-dehydrogenase n=1 Tax=Corynebacterium mendelii TaxID=2765362 RepID=A0A939E3X1_9CORY|nr:UDP-glucose/GDP-mannose dehydrogenase family protein [Corynebacterium mendelii]MBN9645211.1 UDP-glucose/GDP-mannose dehydrogenase family protein [Corynebacterium mendelii]
MKLSVIGIGYLGLTHAVCMASLGHDVIGVDVDTAKVEAAAAGRVPFFEPGLDELLARTVAAGSIRFTTDFAEAAAFADVHFICVGTPQSANSHAADTGYVTAAVESLARHCTGDHVIMGKSTVPVGMSKQLERVAHGFAGDTARFAVIWNPEFLREGHAVDDTLHPDRIVIGIDDKTAPDSSADDPLSAGALVRRVEEIYATPIGEGTPFLVCDTATAELVKVSANAFLATKISFINAVAEVCETAGADVVRLAEALGMDERIGNKFLGAGLGFGGGCLPKDIRAFMARAGELGANEALTFLREVDTINLRRREKMVQLIGQCLGGSVAKKKITILGCAFKPNSDDVRDSPALAVAGALSLMGADVSVFDPAAMGGAKKLYPTLRYAADITDALSGADAVGVATEWAQFIDLDPHAAGEVVHRRIMVDGRNCLDTGAWRAAGWQVSCLGRGNL